MQEKTHIKKENETEHFYSTLFFLYLTIPMIDETIATVSYTIPPIDKVKMSYISTSGEVTKMLFRIF